MNCGTVIAAVGSRRLEFVMYRVVAPPPASTDGVFVRSTPMQAPGSTRAETVNGWVLRSPVWLSTRT